MTTDTWSDTKELYTPDQVRAVLADCNIEVVDETENDFISLCPYHSNTDSPAFSTSKMYGYSVCFNPACAVGTEERLTLEKLVRQVKKLNPFEAKRLIILKKDNEMSFKEQFDAISDEPEELPEFSQAAIDKMHDRFWDTPAAVEYMKGRGFERETLEKFKVGFSPATKWPQVTKPDMIMVPAYDHRSRPIGLVGRSLVGKEFKNFGTLPGGRGFHKSKIVWNLNNARKYEKIIITESTFDSMRADQAGYPNTGALLGGSLSVTQELLLRRHFTGIIVCTDNENPENGEMTYPRACRVCLKKGFKMCQGHAPGRELGLTIAKRMSPMRITWGFHDDKYVYANNVKDLSAMTDDEIRTTLRNAISHFDYLELMVA